MPPILEVVDLSVNRGSVSVLRNLNLSLAPGEAIALLGANGAGKTSAVEAIAGLIPKSSGRVLFAGSEISHSNAATIARAGLGLVSQWRDLFPAFTVDETLRAALYAGRNRGRSTIDDIYDLFPRLDERRFQLAGTLSGGEQQMVAIGRALAIEPKVLLLDEPTAGLAPAIVNDLVVAMRKIRERNIPIVLVEQNIAMAASLADNCIVLATGRSAWQGPMKLALNSEEVRHSYFGMSHG